MYIETLSFVFVSDDSLILNRIVCQIDDGHLEFRLVDKRHLIQSLIGIKDLRHPELIRVFPHHPMLRQSILLEVIHFPSDILALIFW